MKLHVLFHFLDHFIGFRVMGRMLAPIPAAYRWRQGFKEWGTRSSRAPCEHLGVLYLAQGYLISEGVLEPSGTFPYYLPCLVCTGAWTENGLLLSSVPNRLSFHRLLAHQRARYLFIFLLVWLAYFMSGWFGPSFPMQNGFWRRDHFRWGRYWTLASALPYITVSVRTYPTLSLAHLVWGNYLRCTQGTWFNGAD